MERTDILELMSTLKLYGMRAAYDEVMATGLKRRHEPARIMGELLAAEIAEKKARSIKYQLTIAKLPLAKDQAASPCRHADQIAMARCDLPVPVPPTSTTLRCSEDAGCQVGPGFDSCAPIS